MLKFPPYRYKPPESVLFHKERKLFGRREHVFLLYSVKAEEKGMFSEMICFRDYVYEFWKRKPSLYIAWLYSNGKGHGLGSKLLKVAQRFSREQGCEGNIHLTASSHVDKTRLPHLFYRKNGMNSKYDYQDKMMDKMIKDGQTAQDGDFPSLTMYYPPRPYKAPSVKERFKRFISNFVDINKK